MSAAAGARRTTRSPRNSGTAGAPRCPPAEGAAGDPPPAPPSHASTGSAPPAAASASTAVPTSGNVATATPPIRAIVSRLETSMGDGRAGHGVRTTARTSSPAARAASSVSSVWLIVPRPGRAATTSGSPRATARSRIA